MYAAKWSYSPSSGFGHLKPGAKFMFREGKTKGTGIVQASPRARQAWP